MLCVGLMWASLRHLEFRASITHGSALKDTTEARAVTVLESAGSRGKWRERLQRRYQWSKNSGEAGNRRLGRDRGESRL